MKEQFHSDIQEIEWLIVAIWRIRAAQTAMLRANRALRRGDRSALRELGFSEQHIASLAAIQDGGLWPFPKSAFRNNRRLLRLLIGELEARSVALGMQGVDRLGVQILGDGASLRECRVVAGAKAGGQS